MPSLSKRSINPHRYPAKGYWSLHYLTKKGLSYKLYKQRKIGSKLLRRFYEHSKAYTLYMPVYRDKSLWRAFFVEGLPQQTPLPPAIPGLASTRSSQKERVEFPKLVAIHNPLIGQMLVIPEVARAFQNILPRSTRIERPSESQSEW